MDAARRALLPTEEAVELLELTVELAEKELAPRAADYEAVARFPREVFRTLGRAGLLGLPYPERYGGAGQPYEVYLQVLEEVARHWLAIGIGMSVHTLSCHALALHGTEAQKEHWLPNMIGGDELGAYCLSEPSHGSDAANLTTRARRDDGSAAAGTAAAASTDATANASDGSGTGDRSVPGGGAEGGEYVLDGTKAWITHGGEADFYTVLARTGGPGARGISAFLVDAKTPGLTAAAPEHKMGLRSSTTAQVHFDAVRVPENRRLGAEGEGFGIAMGALDAGRLGIAACAVGLMQACLDASVQYARERSQFGKPIIELDGVGFMLADMATRVDVGRGAYLTAARLKDRGAPFSRQAAAAKLYCSDAAMQTSIDAVQVFGGYGYTADFPVERYMREAKMLQIVEGTSQIQRRVIATRLARP
jgi:hypothetical protein